jgi:hypothetical protein
MSIGWVLDLSDAQSYFTDERLETGAWDNLYILDSSGTLNEKVLLNAYNRLYYLPEYTLPTYAEATSADLVILRKAQCEMAYYLCVHLADEDRRKGIQAQGVVEADIVGETYDRDWIEKAPIPAFVIAMLSGWLTAGKVIYPANVERIENEPEVNIEVRRKSVFPYAWNDGDDPY